MDRRDGPLCSCGDAVQQGQSIRTCSSAPEHRTPLAHQRRVSSSFEQFWHATDFRRGQTSQEMGCLVRKSSSHFSPEDNQPCSAFCPGQLWVPPLFPCAGSNQRDKKNATGQKKQKRDTISNLLSGQKNANGTKKNRHSGQNKKRQTGQKKQTRGTKKTTSGQNKKKTNGTKKTNTRDKTKDRRIREKTTLVLSCAMLCVCCVCCVCVCCVTRPGCRGSHTTARELQTCTFQGPCASKTPPKFHERTPKREKKERKLWRREGKKREILGLPPFGALLFGAPPFGVWAPHPSGPPSFGSHLF